MSNYGRGQGQQQQGQGERNRGPTHRVIAKPDTPRRGGGREARYEVIGVGWQSERGGISIRFHQAIDLARIVADDWHVMIVREDDAAKNDGGNEGGDWTPPDEGYPG